MGCTPSIHVSQTGIVYCRESDESTSPHPSSSAHQVHFSAAGAASNPTPRASTPPSSTSARTKQRHPGICSHSNQVVSVKQTAANTMKMTETYINFGPMRVQQHTMSIMLVFGKEDSVSDAFCLAAEKNAYQCNLARNSERALECYLDRHHDVVIIDVRHSKYFDAESLCRSIRATRASQHTVIVAVTKKISGEEPSVLPLLTAGFNRRFIENSNVSVCQNELLSLEYGEVRAQVKLTAADALLAAVENSTDPVEITNEHSRIQYVNPAYERLFGYTSDELLGKDIKELLHSEKNQADLQDTMISQLKKGKVWDGVYHTKRKSGDSFSHHARIAPVFGQSGKIRHLVSIKNPTADGSQRLEKYNDFSPGSSGSFYNFPRRKESMARIHSMTIEAPITRVINIINSAQEDSPVTVVQALDKVLEILHSSELYSPYFAQHMKDDQMTSDYVGGLMTAQQTLKKRFSTNEVNFPRQVNSQLSNSSSGPPASSATLSQMSQEMRNILSREPNWDFDIIALERLTQKRTLVYLGLQIFQRFGVLEFLRVPEQMVVNWLQLIEANYHSSNPYHTSTHAADVLHASAYFCGTDRCKGIFDQMDEVGVLIAAVIHDLNHPGKTNSFLVNAGNELALLYNDLAVLESHHVCLAFQLTTRDDRVNIFKNLDRDDFRNIRQQIIDMVLATEMTKHFEHLNKFVSSITNPAGVKEEDAMSDKDDTMSVTSRLGTQENRTLIKRMLIKCADVSNPTRPKDLCVEWAKRIATEYCHQTDEEKRLSLPVVMPVFDRKQCNVPKSQTSFIDFFIKDMFNEWHAFCEVPELIDYLHSNYQYWKSREEPAAKEIAEKLAREAEENKSEENELNESTS